MNSNNSKKLYKMKKSVEKIFFEKHFEKIMKKKILTNKKMKDFYLKIIFIEKGKTFTDLDARTSKQFQVLQRTEIVHE